MNLNIIYKASQTRSVSVAKANAMSASNVM